MKIQSWIVTAAAVLTVSGAAWAESVSGTITNIDPSSGRVTLRRAGNSENLEVTIRDRAALANLRSGSSVSLDANRLGSGSWEASTIESSGISGTTSGSTGGDNRSAVAIGSGMDRERTTLNSDSGLSASSAARTSGASFGTTAGNTMSGAGSTGASTGVSSGATGTSGGTSAAGSSGL